MMNDDRVDGVIAYLGPEGTYSHAALLKHFGAGRTCRSFTDIPDIFASVEKGESDLGLVPVENSSEGSVTLTLDCFSASDLLICGEVMLRIHHCLMVGEETETITRIVSHPQSLAQCRNWLKKHYPEADRVPAGSNAEAARIAAVQPGTAAIAGRKAAALYGVRVVTENIEDSPDNATRFLVIGRDVRPAESGRDKTSIIMSTPDEPGILFRTLEPFHRHNVNLSKLESRPSRKTAWSYSFFVDIAGHAGSPAVKAALEELGALAVEVKFLGSYPVASH